MGHGFLLSRGSFTTIDFPEANLTYVAGINPRGDIVGRYLKAGVFHGFLLRGGTFTTIDFPGASANLAYGINAKGNIVGQYGRAGVTHGYLLTRR
jgi:hypothetical protein